LTRAVVRQLGDLGFRQCRFEITLTGAAADTEVGADLAPPGPTGFGGVEFQFAPNPGEPARPLRAIASSGELARVMLALKTVLANEDEIPVLVFDEVDANVGGETARAVGDKMRRIARHRQVFCVTHLPQVAAAADAHFAVTKETREGRTFTRMQRLDSEDRVTELARMLGGQTEAARQHALALLTP
jgi:DNA repair protein RecN (Recombination protein N)